MEPVSVSLGSILASVLSAYVAVGMAYSGAGPERPAPVEPRFLPMQMRSQDDAFRPLVPVMFTIEQRDGRPVVKMSIQFDDADGLADFTTRHVGENVGLAVCGEVLMTPRIVAPITQGEIVITGPEVVDTLKEFIISGCPQ